MSDEVRRALRRIAPFVAAIALAVTLVACGDDDDDASSTATATAPGVTRTATAGPDDASPIATAPTAAAGDATPTVSAGDGTGVEIADMVVAAEESGDAAGFAALLTTQRIACTNEQGAGGPPKCFNAPGDPAEGTPVDVFPYSTCELEWQFDVDAFAERWLAQTGELYAVVRIDEEAAPDALPPEGGHAAIFTSMDPSFETSHAVLMSPSGVISAISLCGGRAEAFLEEGPPLFGPEVVFEGPAFE